MYKADRAEKLKERQRAYYSLDNNLYDMREKLSSLEKHKGHSIAFKMLLNAIDLMSEQIRNDFSRYEKRVRNSDNGDTCIEMQKALNREKLKNAELEKKIEEAKTSSGLFIDFVRSKLGMK